MLDIISIPHNKQEDTDDKIVISLLFDPMRPEKREQYLVEYDPGKPLSFYLAPLLQSEGLVAAVNGNVIRGPWDETIVQPGDKIAVSANHHGALVGAIAFYIAQAATYYSMSTTLFMMAYYAAYVVAYAAIMYSVSYLVNALASTGTTDKSSGTDSERSPSYSWGGLQPTYSEGVPIPIIIGTNKVSGHVLNQYTEVSDDNKEYLNMVLAVGYGEIDSITDIKLNDRDASDFEGVVTYTCMGDNTGTVFPNFNHIYTHHSYNTKESGTGTQITTDGNSVEKIELDVTCPFGCYYSNDAGSLSKRTATFNVYYRIAGETEWILDNSYEISGKTTDAIRKKITVDSLSPEQYDIYIVRTNAEETSYRGNNDLYVVAMREIIKAELAYPGIAKYAFRALATDQLSGAAPTPTCIVTKASASIYDNDLETWDAKAITNVAWATWYILNHFGHYAPSSLDWDAWSDWATFCDTDVGSGEKQAIVNTIIDTEGTLWEKAQMIAALGRGRLYRKGSTISVFVDKAESIVSHLFTFGNIVEDSFILQYLPVSERANCIEVTYTDPDRGNDRKIVQVKSSEYEDSTSLPRKTSISYTATLPRAQVIRDAAYKLNSNKWLIRAVEFGVYIDAFAVVLGDLFYFQHDIANYATGVGGRIVTAENNGGVGYVTLDREVTLAVGSTYAVVVRLSNDTIVEKVIDDYADPDDHTTFALTSAWATVPSQYDPYAFGVSASYKKTYRVTNVSRQDDRVMTITGLEYIEDIYDEQTNYVIEEPTWEAKTQEAFGVWLNEYLAYANDGSYVSNINVSWHPAYSTEPTKWEVWLENITLESGTATKKVATTDNLNVNIPPSYLVLGNEYKVYVTIAGFGPVDTGNNTATITIQGKLAPPSDVAVFSGAWNSVTRTVHFSWTAITDIDLWYYQIREGASWATGTIVIPHAVGTSDSLYIGEGVSETRTYWIKAIDTSGIGSETALSDDVSINTADCPLSIPTGLALSSTSTIQHDGQDRAILLASWNTNAESSDYFWRYELELEHISSGYTSEHTARENLYNWELAPNVQYGVRVRAVAVDGNPTSWCAQQTRTTASDANAPATPTWPASSSIMAGFKVIGLNWNDNTEDDLAHYEIQRSLTGAFTGEQVSLGFAKKSFMTDSGLAVSTPYWYRLRAIDNSGNASAWSTSKTTTTLQVGSSDIAYNAISANHIDVSTLDAITANVGTLMAGIIQSTNWGTSQGFQIDLTNQTIKAGGSSNPFLSITGSTASYRGTFTIEEGSEGISNLSDAGALATEDYFPQLPSDKSLLGYWSFNEISGTIIFDGTTNENNGTIVGAATRGVAASGNGLHCDGSTGYVNCGNSSIFNFTSGDFSVSFWFIIDDTPTFYERLISRAEYFVSGWEVSVNPSNCLCFYTYQSSASQYTRTGALTPGVLYHAVISRDGAAVKIYVNGVDSTAVAGTHINPTTSTKNLLFGWISGINYFDGTLDEVRIYNKALTESEARALYLNPSGNYGLANLAQSWKATGKTTIDGGRIETDSITATQLIKSSALITYSAQIGTAVVTEAKIGSAAVTNAKIGNLAVTEAKIGSAAVTNAKIGNASVTTLKIGEEQVTIPRHAFTAGAVTIASVTWTPLQNVSITAILNTAIYIHFNCVFDLQADSYSNFPEISIRIYRDSTLIQEYPDIASTRIAYSTYSTISIVTRDITLDGNSHTYYVQAHRVGNGYAYASSRALFLLSTMR